MLEGLDAPTVGFHGLAARQQVVPRKSIGDVDEIAEMPDPLHGFLKNNFHTPTPSLIK
jgi:hypothetical protein